MKNLTISEILDFNLEPTKSYVNVRDEVFEVIPVESAKFYLLDSQNHRIFTLVKGNFSEIPYFFNEEYLDKKAKYFLYLEPGEDYDFAEVLCEATN